VEIASVGVVGCGTMGAGICEVVARAGLPVTFVERDEEQVQAGLGRIGASLDRALERGKLDGAEREQLLRRISASTELADLDEADFVVEAVPEELGLKQAVLAQVDKVLKPEAILATNTSSLPIMDMAAPTSRPDRVLGFHFFNPAPVMPLIELVTTVVTPPDVVEEAQRFAERLGKTAVTVKDRAGFVVNLLLFPYLNQAVGMLEDGYATREDIDAAMQLGAGHPMGPLALTDLIGLDSTNSILERMYEQFGDVRYAPRPLIRQLLAADFLGRKSGRGFYAYAGPGRAQTVADGPPDPAPVDPTAIEGWTSVGVVGTGTMASGIAEVAAKAGFDVIVRGRSAAKAEAAIGAIARSLDKAVSRGKLAEDARDDVLQRLRPAVDLGEVADCDIVIEAVAEDLALKQALFAEVDAHAKPDALLATTTSSLPVVACAMATSRPERVVGIHFFNPAAVMRLVEVVDSVRTSGETLRQARAFTAKVRKHGVRCGDRAGFIVNALLFPYLNDAVKMLADGYATVDEIDTAIKLGAGHPMGPFALMDIVGLDVTNEILKALHAEFRDPGFAPAPLLGHMVEAGYLGRKTGRGFHVYR
jgi:3-hydroxybutyryl-CoA dehydrogenase